MKKLLSSIGIALLIIALAVPGAVLAAEATASRDLPATAVEPGAEFEVGITASGYGTFGQVVETLPAGFSYVSSSLDASQVDVAGSVVSFILIGEASFTYSVTASTVEDTYAFSGIIKDFDKNEFTVLDDTEITVSEAAPPATTASRVLPATAVEPGAEFEVGITASGYGMMGQVLETLPADFSYVTSSLDAFQVNVAGSVVSFVLIGDTSFTYIVTASTVEDTYAFSGIIKDIDLNEFTVLDDTEITVSGAPSPAPVASFTAFPTTGDYPLEVFFTDTSDSYDGIITYEWDCSYDGVNFIPERTGPTPTYIYEYAGTYSVALRVTDADGSIGMIDRKDLITVTAPDDTTPPTVESTLPLADAPDVAIVAPVTATFDEDVTLVDETGVSIVGSISGDLLIGVSLEDRTLTIGHEDFASGEDITVTIASGVVEDLAGNLNDEISWGFSAVTITHTLTMAVTGSGTTDPAVGDHSYAEGTVVDISATAADTGWSFDGWSGDLSGDTNPTTITMDGNKTVTATFASVGPISFTTTLLEGWNLLSTPIKLDADSDSLGQIFGTGMGNIEVSYSWDGGQWAQVLTDYELLPLHAIYVKVSSGDSATAEFFPSGELSCPPSRELKRGLNLIGPAPALEEGAFPYTPLDQALWDIAEAEGGLTGYTIVVSPAHNQPGWAYALGMEVRYLLPYKGYWVVMENPDTFFGFSTTP